MSVQHPSPRGWSIRSLLAVVVALPLCGVFWFAAGQVRDARQEVEMSAALEDQVEKVTGLTELEVALRGELVWLEVLASLEVLDIDESVVVLFTGFDFRAEVERNSIDVDRLIAALDLENIDAVLGEARSSADIEGYGRAIDLVVAERESSERRLFEVVVDRADSSQLLADVTALQASSELWLAVSQQLELFFTLQFRELSGDADPLMLVEAQLAHRSAVDRLVLRGESDPALGEQMAVFVNSESQRVINATIDDYLAGVMAGRTVERASLTDVLGVLGVTEETGRLHSELLSVSATLVDERVSTESSAAARQQFDVWWLVAALAAASVVLVAVVAAQISRPLKALASSAQALSDGEHRTVQPPAGPREIRIVGDAIAQTAAVLTLVERQAEALTADRLDDPALSAEVPGRLGASLEGALTKLASSLADRAEFERMLWHEAHHDALTGLANRRAVMQHLKDLGSTRSGHAPCSVLLMDLDRFKEVNDRHGHQAGDVVLRAASERLARAVRPGDFLGRLGGDEFIAVLGADGDLAEEIAQRIVDEIAQPIDIGGEEISIGISVGIAESPDGSTLDIEDLLSRADAASYCVKRAGGRSIGHGPLASSPAE